MEDVRSLLAETVRFVLSAIERELRLEIDWRAAGEGRGIFRRAVIYAAAMARDLARIPLHHPDGIAQARFRARIRYIESTALPTVQFLLDRHPLSQNQRDTLSSAESELAGCLDLMSDGRISALDAWYATMDEFTELTRRSDRAADALASVIGDRNGPAGAEPERDRDWVNSQSRS
jgi:hypothetical protein